MIRETFPEVKQLSTHELGAWLEDTTREPPLILDVRAPEEFAVSHLRDAQLAPDLATAIPLVRSIQPDRAIIVYCSVGYRSSRLARFLLKETPASVWNLEGSIFQWANEGRAVYRGATRVDRVHPYNEEWGQLLNPRFWRSSANS
jgi:rhodanese-related sulfurtransferase